MIIASLQRLFAPSQERREGQDVCLSVRLSSPCRFSVLLSRLWSLKDKEWAPKERHPDWIVSLHQPKNLNPSMSLGISQEGSHSCGRKRFVLCSNGKYYYVWIYFELNRLIRACLDSHIGMSLAAISQVWWRNGKMDPQPSFFLLTH